MNTLDFLRQENRRLFNQGKAVIEQQDQIRHETKSQEIKEGATLLWHDGLNMMREANALWPLIRMYRAHEWSYWFLWDKKIEELDK